MDYSDKKILEHQLSVPIGRAVNKWAKENDIRGNVVANVVLQQPSCYVDECGLCHTGNLIVVNCEIVDDDVIGDDDDDE